MSILRRSHIKQHKAKAALYIAALLAFIAGLVYFGSYIKAIFTSAEDIQNWVLSYGKLAPVVMFALQVGQVLIAPLNNFIINLAGGYLFGPWVGFLLNYFGWIAGAILVFWFSRLFGRRFVSMFIKEKQLAGFDDIVSKGRFIVFMLLLLPGPPDDFLVYFMGLTPAISFRTFLWMVLIGKIPGKIATSFLGAGIADHNAIGIVLYSVFIAGSLIVFWRKPELWKIWYKRKKIGKASERL